MEELDPPRKAVVTKFDALDQVGRVQVYDGEELRFGATACEGFRPTNGAEVFVTAVAPHPLGGRKAVKMRTTATTEAKVRAEGAARAAEAAEREAAAAAARKREALPRTTPAAITERVLAAVLPEEDHEADAERLYALVDDLEAVGPSIEHVTAILRGMAEAHPSAHFGSPGPLVHFIEKVPGFEAMLFEAAEGKPRSHFGWMLARCVNGQYEHSEAARAILESYRDDPAAPEDLRSMAKSFLGGKDGQ